MYLKAAPTLANLAAPPSSELVIARPESSMPSTTVAIIAGVALAVVAALAIWRSGRKPDAMATYLKNAAVSRQWLMEHQGEDRS